MKFKLVLVGTLFACILPAAPLADSQLPAAKPHIIFAGSKYYPPLEWADEDSQAQGWISELVDAMSKHTGSSHQVKLSQWSDALDSVLTGNTDAIALIPSESRSQLYDYTQPFYYIAHGIFSHLEGPHFGSLEELVGHRVAVVRQAFGEEKVRDAIQKNTLDTELLIVDTELDCVTAVASRDADACIEVLISSNHLIRINKLPVGMTSPPMWPQPYVFAVKKGNAETLNLLNEQLAAVIVSGEYTDLYKQWAHELEWRNQTFWDKVTEMAQVFLVLITLISFAFLWSFSLRSQVKKRTEELERELSISHELRSKLTHQANHDFTTDLLNRRHFFEVLDNQLAELKLQDNKSISVLAIQITNIAEIITAFGYESALQTLNHVANKLRNIEHSVAGHFGSGQYLICSDSNECIQDIIFELRKPQADISNAIEPLLSFGVTHLSTSQISDQNSDKVIDAPEAARQAITALAHAIKKRLPWFEYTPRIDPESNNLRLINEFHRFGCEHFVLYYQPQLCLPTDTVLHAEALVRWNHPKLGLLPPGKFIPLLENSGMIQVVTRWVIEQSIAMIQRNKLEANGCAISVNISTRDLLDSNFVSFVKSATKQIKPSSLILEITESDLFDDAARAKQAIADLHNLGFKLAVDDYGTGYSNLSYLNDLDVDEIKLDRSFVANIVHNERSRKIVKSTIELAHELGLLIVAEGVEDQQTLEELKSLGCDRIQGYLIARPMSETDIVKSFKL